MKCLHVHPELNLSPFLPVRATSPELTAWLGEKAARLVLLEKMWFPGPQGRS